MRTSAGLVVLAVALAVLIRPALADDLQVTVVSITSQVSGGEPITLVVQTEPKASCEAAVRWEGVKGGFGNRNLRKQTTDSQGKVTWTWNAPKGFRSAKGQVLITCTAGGKTGKAQASVSIP